ncbi:MAG: hypothetical protein R3A80_06925 [Bdellovibrionota bacterium]
MSVALLARLLIASVFILAHPSANASCKKELGGKAKADVFPWGKGKVLLLADMARYCEVNNIKPPKITYAAMHYGKTHRADASTIAAVKKHLAFLKKEINRVDERLDDLDFKDPRYQTVFKELTDLSGEHQLQLESLEMMEWESAWKLAYGKKDVMDSYPPEERYPIDDEERPYPPK